MRHNATIAEVSETIEPAKLHRVYVPMSTNPQLIIGYVRPIDTIWEAVRFKEPCLLVDLINKSHRVYDSVAYRASRMAATLWLKTT